MTAHPNPALIARYADREADLDETTVWSVEVHLEACAACRGLLAGAASESTRAALGRVADAVAQGIAAGPAPARRRRLPSLHRWAVGYLVPWLVMTVAVLGVAVLLGALAPGLPSLVMLLAPVAPLPGVAVAWSRRHDPAWELIAGTPSAGLTVLLRRTAVVLAVVIPALALASSGTGVSLALTLLPCLAFTAATIGFGSLVGVVPAAAGFGAIWALAVVAPALRSAHLPAVLQAGSAPAWLLLTVLLTGFAAVRAGALHRPFPLT